MGDGRYAVSGDRSHRSESDDGLEHDAPVYVAGVQPLSPGEGRAIDVSGEFRPSSLIMTALAAGTLAPPLVIMAIRQLWPQWWAPAIIVGIAAAGTALSVWFFRRAVPDLSPNIWQIKRTRPRSAVSGFIGLYTVPCTVALAAQPSARWAAAAALALIALVAVRSGSILTNNPLMVLLGLHTHDVDLHRPGAEPDQAQSVTVLMLRNAPECGDVARLISIGRSLYVQAPDGPAAACLATSWPS